MYMYVCMYVCICYKRLETIEKEYVIELATLHKQGKRSLPTYAALLATFHYYLFPPMHSPTLGYSVHGDLICTYYHHLQHRFILVVGNKLSTGYKEVWVIYKSRISQSKRPSN